MNIESVVTDNITELLIKIMEFTQTRQKILTRNINNLHTCGFVPKDLDVSEFCDLLNYAIDEHASNNRLVLKDTENIKFGINGNFEIKSSVDNYAKDLLEGNTDEYLELQVNKLLENSLNQRVAAELLKQRQGVSFF